MRGKIISVYEILYSILLHVIIAEINFKLLPDYGELMIIC